MADLIKIKDCYYLSIPLTQVNQGGKGFFLGIVPAKHFKKLYTVDPVVYDLDKEIAIKEKFPDMKEYFEKSIAEKRRRVEKKGFQREYDKKRAIEISEFLNSEEYPFFPNSIIATCDLLQNVLSDDLDNEESACLLGKVNSNLSIFEQKGEKYVLHVPYKDNSILVIDGQHRLEGIKRADDGVIEDYDLIVSFILGYDRSVIARLFYTINYTQKSVNKSLLYHLTGEFSENLDDITFLHEVIKTLNASSNSPFFKRIKMLGVAPKNVNKEDKKLMTLSQAFLIDYLLYTISNRNTSSIVQPIFYYYYNKNLKYEIIRFIVSYFTAVRKIFPSWDDPESSMISKTMGVGALLKVMNFVFLKAFFDLGLNDNPLGIKEIRSDEIIKMMEGIQNVSLDRFLGGSSAGSVNQLRNLMIESISSFEAKNYDQFEEKFRSRYAIKFQNWLNKN